MALNQGRTLEFVQPQGAGGPSSRLCPHSVEAAPGGDQKVACFQFLAETTPALLTTSHNVFLPRAEGGGGGGVGRVSM